MDRKTGYMLRTLVVKPVIACNADCGFCASRLRLHRQASKEKLLSLSQWCQIIDDACSLGLQSLYISGGEPTLYPELYELVGFSKRRKVLVTLNTNGLKLDEKMASGLAEAGLDSCVLSMYSHLPAYHDRVKGVPGIHARAVRAVSHLRESGITAKFLTVLTSGNIFELPAFIRWAAGLGVSKLDISYLEGGSQAFLPTVQDIKRFRDETVPECVEVIDDVFRDRAELHERNLRVVRNLFNFPGLSDSEIARGFYQSLKYKGCGRSRSFSLLLANGDVHPCNAVEYFHEPVAGNLFKASLEEIWGSEVYDRVRENGAGWCRMCPMARHSKLYFQESEMPHPAAKATGNIWDGLVRRLKK